MGPNRIKLVSLLLLVFLGGFVSGKAPSGDRYFSDSVLHGEWKQFDAKEYATPVTGVVYRGNPRPVCGMPLGGLDTGCIDIEPTGMLGYSTIFNHLVNPRLLINMPFLGLNVDGKTWVLVSDKKAKAPTPTNNSSIYTFPPTDYTPRYNEIEGLKDIQIAEWIDYWGHFPIVDAEFKTTAPVEIGMRAFSPFVPGDSVTSMLPGTVFEFSLRNNTNKKQTGTLAFSFPGFMAPAMGDKAMKRQTLDDGLKGLYIQSPFKGNALEMGYVLATMDGQEVRTGGPLNSDGAAWAKIDSNLPAASDKESGACLAMDFDLKAGKSKTIRVILSWYAPHWQSSGQVAVDDSGTTDTHTHMYAKHYTSAMDAARKLSAKHDKLLKRVITWQEVIYQHKDMPGWLADSLINVLHLVPECSIWGQAKAPIGEWCKPEDGVFGLNECPRGCPQIECIPCSFYGNIPVVYFFPEAALSTLRGYKAYQSESGRPPWIFGGCTARNRKCSPPYGLARPDEGYQVVLNAACYIVMADRYWQTYGDNKMLAEFWDSLKRANDYCLNLRPDYGPSQVMAMPAPGSSLGGGVSTAHEETEWFEAPEPGWRGYVTHAGAVRMAEVIIMKRMAEAMDDAEYIKKCDEWLEAGSEALEKHLWAGTYYLNFNEPESNTKSDLIFGYQLDGEWITDWHGLPGVFPKDKVDITLKTIRDINCQLSQSGATNYASADGKPVKIGGYGTYGYFPPELMMLSMNYMYEGQKDFGLDLLRKCLYNITCKWGYTWEFPNTVRGDVDTGQQAFGADYYQNMMLWAVPAALDGKDIKGPMERGGLVDRVLKAK